MNKVQENKKRIYGLFSDSFFQKKRQVEIVAENAYMVRRPYKGMSNQLAVFSNGIESVYSIFIGFGTCIWLATGAFLYSKNAGYKFSMCILFNIFSTFCCDLIKVKILHPHYEDTIKGVLSTYSFEDKK